MSEFHTRGIRWFVPAYNKLLVYDGPQIVSTLKTKYAVRKFTAKKHTEFFLSNVEGPPLASGLVRRAFLNSVYMRILRPSLASPLPQPPQLRTDTDSITGVSSLDHVSTDLDKILTWLMAFPIPHSHPAMSDDNEQLSPERLDIIKKLQLTNDVAWLRQIIREHPDIALWPEFYVGGDQRNCCIINIILQMNNVEWSDMMGVYISAVKDDDHYILNSLLRHRPGQLHKLLLTFAIERSSEKTLNLLCRYFDPKQYLDDLRDDMLDATLRFLKDDFIKLRSSTSAISIRSPLEK
ncbi:uncharacterized protein EV422DRAFT_502523 [Fimicolochytrium jonesii]|uniref:uncharacterized protein n=1 Tax=Fimicolochytrium jonesii TaxID=1396493 RepID=UPI0022FE7478|nr:uncharacterized protein EV422DRAFT_502523 [Fimicolochytrium jonesii]KAI8826768.1 hypothetical protein EV422DRAFT_502523 [Fimicolochytrium jonesii]